MTAKSELVTHVTASENVARIVNGTLVIAGAVLERTTLGSVPSYVTESCVATSLLLAKESTAAEAGISTVTGPLAEGLISIVYTLPLTVVNADLVLFVTIKSPLVTHITASENVAVTVKSPLVGLGTLDVSTTVGTVASISNVVPVKMLLTFDQLSVTVIVQSEYIPSANRLKVIVFDQVVANVVTLIQLHP